MLHTQDNTLKAFDEFNALDAADGIDMSQAKRIQIAVHKQLASQKKLAVLAEQKKLAACKTSCNIAQYMLVPTAVSRAVLCSSFFLPFTRCS